MRSDKNAEASPADLRLRGNLNASCVPRGDQRRGVWKHSKAGDSGTVPFCFGGTAWKTKTNCRSRKWSRFLTREKRETFRHSMPSRIKPIAHNAPAPPSD